MYTYKKKGEPISAHFRNKYSDFFNQFHVVLNILCVHFA
jgi:hypothetical protein